MSELGIDVENIIFHSQVFSCSGLWAHTHTHTHTHKHKYLYRHVSCKTVD